MGVPVGIVAIAATVIVVTAAARRGPVPAPLVLTVVGLVASFLPWIPDVELTPELVLVGFVPALLYSAALNTSLIDLRANMRPITLLSVGLVIFTTLVVGAVARWVLPISWPAALALGAVVAPPDAVAATAIARRVGMPRRIVTILEGESLVNDATALVVFRTAIAAIGGSVTAVQVAGHLAVSVIGGLAVGGFIAFVVGRVRRVLRDPLSDTAVSFITPFTAYLLAEEIRASGVLAVVVTGLILSHRAQLLQSASSRIFEQTNWSTVSYLLENTVFLLIGLQVDLIVRSAAHSNLGAGTIVWACVAVTIAVVAVRPIWVYPATYLARLIPAVRRRDPSPRWQGPAVLSWAGMRGVVTLAAAFALPADTPQRSVVILCALVVVGFTLIVQGATLPWLVRRLGLSGPSAAQDALFRADVLQRASSAGLAYLDEHRRDGDPPEVIDRLRNRTLERTNAAWELLGNDAETPSQVYARLRVPMIEAERREVLRVREEGIVPHEVLQQVFAMIDIEESMLDLSGRVNPGASEEELVAITQQAGCDHLAERAPVPSPDPPEGCSECLRDGTVWVHLRICLGCGHVGCCDSSVGRHATRHYDGTRHPVMQSFEPGEAWRWCYVDEITG